jgi:hypothetical protein
MLRHSGPGAFVQQLDMPPRRWFQPQEMSLEIDFPRDHVLPPRDNLRSIHWSRRQMPDVEMITFLGPRPMKIYGKSPFFMGLTISTGPFSIAMLVYRRVSDVWWLYQPKWTTRGGDSTSNSASILLRCQGIQPGKVQFFLEQKNWFMWYPLVMSK